MKTTISTSNADRNKKGKMKVSIEHNLREENAVKKSLQWDAEHGLQPHIDKSLSCRNITLINQTVEEAYDHLLGEAVERYNALQKRKDRQTSVKKEMEKIKKSDKQELVYEMIVEVGNKKNHPDDELCKKILIEFLDQFIAEYPNIYVFNATIHCDEVGSAVHMHIDYIPFKTKELSQAVVLEAGNDNTPKKRWKGIDVQNSLSQALEQMGYTNDATKKVMVDGKEVDVMDKEKCAMAQWQKSFNGLLEDICNQHGLEVVHPLRGQNVKHMDTWDYKQNKAKEELEKTTDRIAELESKENMITDSISVKETTEKNLDQAIAEKRNMLAKLEESITKVWETVMIPYETAKRRFKNRLNANPWLSQEKRERLEANGKQVVSHGDIIYGQILESVTEKELPTVIMTKELQEDTSRLKELTEECKNADDWEIDLG